MKKVCLAACLLLLASVPTFAQDNSEPSTKPIRPASVGFSLIFNDFITARNIRNTSLPATLNNKQTAKLREMAKGVAVHYEQGLTPHLDFAASFGYSSGAIYLENKPDQKRQASFASLDASVQAKMLPENFLLIPYLSAGIGASAVDGYYGAILPLGVGLRLNVSEDFSIGLQSQYRFAVTETAGYHFLHGFTIIGRL